MNSVANSTAYILEFSWFVLAIKIFYQVELIDLVG